MEKRKIKRLKSIYSELRNLINKREDMEVLALCSVSGVMVEHLEVSNEKIKKMEEINLVRTLYSDIETGIKITIYGKDIKGKITYNRLDDIAREKIEKEILRRKGLYEEIYIDLEQTLNSLFELDENLVFTDEEIFTADFLKNEIIEEYEDLSNDFHCCFDGYEFKQKIVDFLRAYYFYEKLLSDKSYFEIPIDEEMKKEREDNYYGDDCFFVDAFTEISQVEKRINDLKIVAEEVFKLLIKLKKGIASCKTN